MKLTSTHGQGGKGVFEDLLKAEEFDDGECHRGMEPGTHNHLNGDNRQKSVSTSRRVMAAVLTSSHLCKGQLQSCIELCSHDSP